MSKQIGTLGTIDTITLGERVLTDLANLIVLYAQPTVLSHYTTFRLPNSTSGYQVTALKTFKIVGFKWSQIVSGGAGANVAVLYGDTDVGLDSASAPTNPVFPIGTNAGNVTGPVVANPSVPGVFSEAFDFDVPAGKYIGTFVPAGSPQMSIAVYGYEV